MDSKMIGSFIPLIVLIVAMYLLLIRPQRKREKEVSQMRSSLRQGDKIVTIGGIYGTIIRIKGDNLIIQIGADKTKLEIARWAVSSILNDDMSARAREGRAIEEEEKKEAAAKKRPKRLSRKSDSTEAENPAEAENPEKTDN